MLNQALAELLASKRPDLQVWEDVTKLIDPGNVDKTTIAELKRALASWPREVPRPAPKSWRGVCAYDQLMRSICLDVKEDEQLYHHYITEICGSPRLRLRDGSPAVNLWRQPRGTVTLQGGGQVTLGAGQPGLADVGGTMTVEWPCCICRGKRWEALAFLDFGGCTHAPQRINLYVEVEIKLDGKIPPLAREYRGTSKRMLTQTEQDQCQRQQAQLARGGCYIFAERVSEAIDELVRYRDEVLARV